MAPIKKAKSPQSLNDIFNEIHPKYAALRDLNPNSLNVTDVASLVYSLDHQSLQEMIVISTSPTNDIRSQ
jgi:hypothetical protein